MVVMDRSTLHSSGHPCQHASGHEDDDRRGREGSEHRARRASGVDRMDGSTVPDG